MPGEEVRLPLTAVKDPGKAFERSLKRLRAERGWTLARLAEEAGLNLALVHSAETGRHRPGLEAAWRIAEALEVSLDAMIRGELPGEPEVPR